MSVAIIVAVIAIIGNLIVNFFTYKNQLNLQKKLLENQERMQEISNFQSKELEKIKNDLDYNKHIITSKYSKKIEILAKIYSGLSLIKFYLESFVVPIFSDSKTGDMNNIDRAKKEFLDLYIYFIRIKFLSMIRKILWCHWAN